MILFSRIFSFWVGYKEFRVRFRIRLLVWYCFWFWKRFFVTTGFNEILEYRLIGSKVKYVLVGCIYVGFII